MEPTAFQEQVDAARREYDAAARALLDRIEKANRAIAKDKARLESLDAALTKKIAAIVQDHSRSVAAGSRSVEPQSIQEAPKAAPTEREAEPESNGHRTKRGALDDRLFVLAQELAKPTVTAPKVTAEWKRRYPDVKASRSTVRGAIERAVRKGGLVVVKEGGRGSANPTVYGLP